jgi:hypothetical protein
MILSIEWRMIYSQITMKFNIGITIQATACGCHYAIFRNPEKNCLIHEAA